MSLSPSFSLLRMAVYARRLGPQGGWDALIEAVSKSFFLLPVLLGVRVHHHFEGRAYRGES